MKSEYKSEIFEAAFSRYDVVITDQILNAAFNDPGFIQEVGADSISIWKRCFLEEIPKTSLSEEFALSVEQVKYKVNKVSTCLRSSADQYQKGVEPFWGAGSARYIIPRFFYPPITPKAVSSLDDLIEMINEGYVYPGMVLSTEQAKPDVLGVSNFRKLCGAVGIDGNQIIDCLKIKQKEKARNNQIEKQSKAILKAIELLESNGYTVEKPK